ncbi:hypothetical protein Tco_1031838 [Tanacetum coccineum]|uniref:Uncharacterized protein n=1 Tax=Tanacetum coccineum TaxID=301880 RepID=A0ABQ5GC57_9ASTR
MKLFMRKDIEFLKYDVKVRDNYITEAKNQLAEALKEKDYLKLKLEKFETSSKKLTDLLNSQISVNNKTGIGFDSQMTENELHDIHKNNSEVFESASDSSVNEIEEENNQVNDRPDLSFVGLDASVYKTNVSETITSVLRNESVVSKSSKDNLEQPKDVRPSAPIVEEITGQRKLGQYGTMLRVKINQNKLTHPHPKRKFLDPTASEQMSGNGNPHMLYRIKGFLIVDALASRPDIMFVVCACARFQVTLKTLHLHAVKRIFRYLKGQPKLGLWYPRDSPFDLEAFSDRQVLWIQNQMLDYGFNFMNTKIYIDNESTIFIMNNPVIHYKTKHIEIRHHFIRDSYEKKLIQVIKIYTDHNVADLLTKAFDVSS